MSTGLGKTPWVDKALAKVLDRIESEVSPEWAPVPILNAPRGRRSFEEYGCGHYGCVLPTRTPGVVLKVTSDPSEAWFVAHVLRGRQHDTEGMVLYLDVRTLPDETHKRRPVYAIWRQEAQHVGGFRKAAMALDDTYEANATAEAEERLTAILNAARGVRETYTRAASPEEWFEKLRAAAEVEDQVREAVWENIDNTRGSLGWRTLRGPLRLAWALTAFETLTELSANEPGLYRVGDALHTYFERGFVLADVHLNNIGKPLDDDGWNSWIITDPGHAVPLRPDLLRVEIKEL